MTATPDLTAAEELRAAGLRVTAVRVALLEAVRHGDHLGVEALAAGVRERVGHVSLQAVYEALNAPRPAWSAASSRPAARPGSRGGSGTTTTTSSAGRAVRSPTLTARSARHPV
jgi:hypothetical protein